MQVNGFLYYVTIHGCTHIVMRVFYDASHRVFFSQRHCSWIYTYRDAGQFSDTSQMEFVARFERIIQSAYVGKELRYSNFESYVGDPHKKLLIQEGTPLWRGILKLYHGKLQTEYLKTH